MAHSVELPGERDDQGEAVAGFSRRGLILSALYFVLFFGFVLLNAFWPAAMNLETIPLGRLELNLGGLNLAVVSGIGLILAAVFLALIDARLTRGAAR